MDKRLLLASPHMSGEGYELEYINDAFRKNWIAPLGENVNEFEKAMGTYMGKGYPVALSAGTAALHLLKPGRRCSHLGCALHWNESEQSWDCPCHGSRFDCRGRLTDNPAKRGISIE